MSKDEYYTTPAARLDTIVGGGVKYIGHFLQLQQAKREYDQLVAANLVSQKFHDYVCNCYGIKLDFVGDHISMTLDIVDEKKYLVFLLKFNGESG